MALPEAGPMAACRLPARRDPERPVHPGAELRFKNAHSAGRLERFRSARQDFRRLSRIRKTWTL